MCVCVCVCIYIYIYIYAYVYVRRYICVCMYVCIYVWVGVCIYVYIYIYIILLSSVLSILSLQPQLFKMYVERITHGIHPESPSGLPNQFHLVRMRKQRNPEAVTN